MGAEWTQTLESAGQLGLGSARTRGADRHTDGRWPAEGPLTGPHCASYCINCCAESLFPDGIPLGLWFYCISSTSSILFDGVRRSRPSGRFSAAGIEPT